MDITLDYGSLYDIVARSLSIIGKRSVNKEGVNIFSNITLGSAEKNIVCDFFSNAFTEICASLKGFLTTEMQSSSSFGSSTNVSFWIQETERTTDMITGDGQMAYVYDQLKLYQASLSFPFSAYSTTSGDIFKYGNDYYDYQLTLIAEPTDEQKAAAVTLDYFGTDPSSLTVYDAGLLAGYNGSVYQSQRNASFTEISPSANTIYNDPSGQPYQWEYGAMQRVPGGIEDSVTLTVTVPDNWNSALQTSLRQALYNYCVSYAIFSWFTITAPHIAEKYLLDTRRQMDTIIMQIHEKKKTECTVASMTDPTGGVS